VATPKSRTEVSRCDRPFTSRAQRALSLADSNAERLNHPYVGTEHLLLGLLEEETGPAAQILNHLGVTTNRVRATWIEVTGKQL
jgi:ATP-dependent Clp protease ATP-binding subunit ClpC